MKKILTAIGNPELNNYLKKLKEFEIVANDIQYQDGIFEILEEKNIDILILSELLRGENSLEQIIKKVKEKNANIKIVLLLEKENEAKIKMAEKENIEKILFHHKTSIQTMISILKEMSQKNNIEEEIENLKKLIMENNHKNKGDNNLIIKLKNKITKSKTKNNINNKKVITFAGSFGTGKSIMSACMAMCLKEEKHKTVILDFDLLNKSINTLFGKKIKSKKLIKNNYLYNKTNKEKKLNNYLDFFCEENIANNIEKNIEKLDTFFYEIKKEYEFCIIDISSNTNINYIKLILQKTDIIIFLIEGNLIEIKKSINLLNIYINEWNIEKNKINIIFNKYNKNSIDEKILKIIFSDFNILGKINYSNNYSLIINKNMKNYFLLKKEKKQHKKILNNILKNKRR